MSRLLTTVSLLQGAHGKLLILTTHEINPGTDAHLFARFHHLKSFIQQYLSRQGVVYYFDDSVGQGEPSSGGVCLHADTTPEGELDHYATT